MTDLEDLIVAEARKLGFAVSSDAVMQSAIDLAGAVLTPQGLLALPGKGTLAPADYARALRAAMPTAFKPLDADRSEATPAGNMTEWMCRQVAATRRKTPLPEDWHRARGQYADSSLTARMMDEIAASRRQGE
jgi:hypothetical protein